MRVRRLLALPLLLLLWGCPYEASFEPEGPLAPRRADLVGRWSCTSDGSTEDVVLLVGWSGASQYRLLARPVEGQAAPGDDSPLGLTGVPRRISGREIWSVWEDDDSAANKLGFLRLAQADRHHLVLEWLGNGESSTSAEPLSTPAELARLLASPRTKVESTIRCSRP